MSGEFSQCVNLEHGEIQIMKKLVLLVFTLCASVACSNASDPADPAAVAALSINALMTDVVTPASNMLWSVADPQTDAQWLVFKDAASQLIAAGEQIKRGGSGPNDATWAADPAWQTFADTLIGAANDARIAAEAKDLDALFNANDVLYPPCEECHIQFHPGVGAEELN
jgi:hypothetical protein